MADGAPDWLYDLLSVFHHQRTTLISFNYDRLVEIGVSSHALIGTPGYGTVSPLEVLRDLPPLPNVGARLGGPMQDTFQLLKLHGSIDWWWVPGDLTGATLNREEQASTFGNYRRLSDDERRQALPGRERFIVPPASGKSIYYRNPLTRELWRRASEALGRAQRIVLFGYSMPPADLVMAGMMQAALRGREVQVEVVNPDPAQPKKRLIGLGVAADMITTCDGAAAFAEKLCLWSSEAVIHGLLTTTLAAANGASLLVSWDGPRAPGTTGTRRVAGISPPGPDGTVELRLDTKPPPVGDATAARFERDGQPSSEVFAILGDLIHGVKHAKRITVRVGDRSIPIIGTRYERRETGANTAWLALVPAGRNPWQP